MPLPEHWNRDRGGPLKGVRVVELTKVWAGPYAGKMLAHLGAEVIKIESMSNLDEMRAYGGVDINSAPYFLSINQEILSVQVNMKTDEGLALVKRMIGEADILIDNIRPGAMERSGLDYENLKKIRVRTRYSHQMTAAARAMAPMKFLTLRSKRVAMRRQSLRRQNMRSMTLRCL